MAPGAPRPWRRRSRAAAGPAAALLAATAGLLAAAVLTASPAAQLEPEAAGWVETTLAGMTLDEKVGQLVMPSFRSTYLSTDSAEFDRLAALVREQHPGGFLLFGGRNPAPDVLLNPSYARSTLGTADGRGRPSTTGCRPSRPCPC